MSKLLVIFAATGQQGGSIIDYVMNDPDLSKQYSLRGITRSLESTAAKALAAKGVELVQADVEQPETLRAAVKGAHVIFSNTATVYDDKLYDREVSSGKAIADAAVEAGVNYIIYSSSTPAKSFTGRLVAGFDSKYVVEEYIRGLPVQSAFFSAATFMQNYSGVQKPRPTGEPGVYAISNIIDPNVKVPMIEIVADTGKFIGAILAEPDKYNGKTLWAASEMHTLPEVAEAIGKATGKIVKYNHQSEEEFKKYLPPVMQEPFTAMFAYLNSPGYYGPETLTRVEWTMQQARGKLTTYDEFLEKNPIKLD